jgi:hypothetical protein
MAPSCLTLRNRFTLLRRWIALRIHQGMQMNLHFPC